MAAPRLCSLNISTAFCTFPVSATSVRLNTIVPAFSTWLLKNSPKFFIYILHLLASTTVTALFRRTSRSFATLRTAFITSDNLPTPEGSIITRSGWYLVNTSWRDFPKSPTSEQQIHPEFISRISIPESFKKPPSIPISPNSFSMSTTCSPATASCNSFLIKVVFPAPKNPEIISIFVITLSFFPFYFIVKIRFVLFSPYHIRNSPSRPVLSASNSISLSPSFIPYIQSHVP